MNQENRHRTIFDSGDPSPAAATNLPISTVFTASNHRKRRHSSIEVDVEVDVDIVPASAEEVATRSPAEDMADSMDCSSSITPPSVSTTSNENSSSCDVKMATEDESNASGSSMSTPPLAAKVEEKVRGNTFKVSLNCS